MNCGTVTLDITLLPRLSGHKLENVMVDLPLGTNASGIKCTTTRAGTGGGGAGSDSSSSSWMYDSKTSTMKWEIPSASAASSWNMRLSFVSARPARGMRIRYEVSGFTYSNLKVDQLRVNTPGMGENYKPYKGVRGRGVGDLEWRW
jgi:AP-3 complex subunit mu